MRITILLLLLTTSICFGQTKYDKYDKLISEANSLKKNSNYSKAIDKYESALDILTPNTSTSFFRIAECALKLGKEELADKWIRKAVSDGGAQMEYLLSYVGFTEIKDQVFFQKIVSDYNLLRQEYFSTIENIDIYLEIERLTSRDQFVRKMSLYLKGFSNKDFQNATGNMKKAKQENDTIAEKKFHDILFCKPKDENLKLTIDLMQKVDSLNILALMEITKEHSWQPKAWLILWHQRQTYGNDNYIWNYFKPLINKEIEDGKLSHNFWNPFDQFLMMKNMRKPGTYVIGENGKMTKIK